MEKRSLGMSDIRAEEDNLKIGGYFVLFNDETELYDGIFETVDSRALDKTLNNDIRCLFNHDTSKVLGRTKSNTLTLEKDDKGLYGEVIINPNDKEAVSVYERVKRGDIDQCSFGFNILDEDQKLDERDNLHITLKEIDLHEVSIVTFPAYPNTTVSARAKQLEDLKGQRLEARKKAMLERIRNGVKKLSPSEEA